MASVNATKDEVDEIRRRMAQIRRELHEDVQTVVAGAEAATDWRRYVRLYPWTCLGAAVAIGFLVVPKKRRQVVERVTVAPTAEAATAAKEEVKTERKAGLIGAAFGMLVPVVTRALQSYAAQYVENWIAQQAAAGMAFGPQPTPPPPPTGPRPRPGMGGRP
ncbi:MAG TPA: hypothetical protein VG406_13585 [Isosphaeraceae bacterium]|nr:hypothetical protein [Isosphaeraceae bacterium]